jgi:proline iminopeptidase
VTRPWLSKVGLATTCSILVSIGPVPPYRGDFFERFGVVKCDLCTSSPEAIRYGMGTTNPATWASMGDWDLRARLSSVSAPTLVIHGEEEAIPMDMVEEWVAALPDARLFRIPGAAHFPYVERPDLVSPEIERFLAETSAD